MHYDLLLIIQGILGYAVIIMVALGFQLIFSTSRMFHFVYAAIYTFIIYIAYWGQLLHFPLVIGIAMAIVFVLAITAIMEYAVYRPMRRRGSSPLVILIASLGMLYILQNGIALVFGSETIILQTPEFLLGSMDLFGFQFSRIEFAELVADVVVFLVVFAILRWSGFGIQVRSVADDSHQASMIGVNVNRIIMAVLLLGSLILVPVAVLDGMNTGGGGPYSGTTTLLLASIIAFVGGIGSVSGTMIVGILAGVVSGISLLIIPSQWTALVIFALLIVAILIRPLGVTSSVKGKRTV